MVEKDISYKDYRKKSDIHGTVLYPAIMIAPVQNDILEKIILNEDIETVFDPFYGSGTSLYEAMKIDRNIKLVGCDINPLAYLITSTKLTGIDKECIYKDIEKIESLVKVIKVNNHEFDKIYKWFKEDIIESLTIIRYSIIEIENIKNRNFFWCMFSDIIRKYSNTRSSTYKLHIKEEYKINNLENNVIKDFLISIKKNLKFYLDSSYNFKIYKNDILNKIKEFKNNEFDISITSPPYGDNHTTVTYGQFSSLALKWIDSKDLKLEGWELDNYSIIDSKSMGGSSKPILLNDYEFKLLEPYLSKISKRKQRKVLLFFDDYFNFLEELCRVTKKYIVMTLGNRRVDNVLIDLTNITIDYLGNYNFRLDNKLSRDIVSKRMPIKTSSVNNKSVSSMNKEYVIIHKKNS